MIPLNELHQRRLLRDYVAYFNGDRLHDSLDKASPKHRPVEPKPGPRAVLTAHPRLGGLHHRYSWREAA